ncbi:MAG: oligosaccharide flippase family protein, partial [Caulobacteraceae bacterium]
MAGFLIRPLSRVPFLFIIGRIYGETAFGRLVFAVGVFEAAAAFARLGVRDNLFRFLAEASEDHEGVIVDCLALAGGLAVLTALVLAAGATLAPAYFGSADLWGAVRALAPLLPVFVLTDVMLAASRAQRTVGYEVAARSVVEPALLTLGAAALGLLGRPSGLLEAYTVAQLASFGIAVLGVARRYRWREFQWPRWSRMRRYAAISLPTGLADCMNLGFLTTGVVAVGQFSGPAALGVYGMAQNLETAL